MGLAKNILEHSSTDKTITKKRGRIKSLSKLQLAGEYIKTKYEIRFNEVSCKVEYKKKGSKEKFDSLNENNLYVELEHNRYEISLSKLKALLNSDFVETYNPFKNYFNSLSEWHREAEKDFIDQLCTFIPTKDPERFKKQFKKMFVRCIACAIDDNIFNKQAFIFVHSGQGSGKTTLCRWLCPPDLKNYITENINVDKDSQIALATNFIINMDELATMSKIEINTLKSFLSKDKINVRLPYDSRTTIKPRRANFVGSTNKDEFLNDETGSVRWLCFELTDKINFEYKEKIDINDIWRQAFTLYKKGFKYELTIDETQENEIANKQYLINTPEMDLIPKHYKTGTKDKHDEFLTSTELLNEISMKYPHIKLSLIAIGKALTFLGFKKGSEYREGYKYSIKGYYILRT